MRAVDYNPRMWVCVASDSDVSVETEFAWLVVSGN